MIDNIIQSVTEKLSSLPYIEGIVLGGSRARGTHTEDSDIDIGIYYKSESFDITAINQIATELDDENRNNLVVPPGAWGDWINGGGWLVINGYHVDLILRDIKRVEQIIKDTEQGIVTANYPDLFNRAATLEENAMPYLKTVKGLGRSYSWKEQFGKE